MGTRVEITAVGRDRALVAARVAAAFGEIDRLEGLLSEFRPDSEVSRINRAAGAAPVAVSPETFEVIERSLEVSRISGGAFDITFAALSGIWDFTGKQPGKAPEPAEIAARLKLVGFGRVQLDPKARTVFLPERGMRIGLGGIAKGYIVDRALEVLQADGIERALVNAGGDLKSFARPGERPGKSGFKTRSGATACWVNWKSPTWPRRPRASTNASSSSRAGATAIFWTRTPAGRPRAAAR